jgi:Protein of unknown function (DUF4242)
MLPAPRSVPHARHVPFYMDRHEFAGLTATDAANMHLRDMALQDKFGVQLLTYWFDYDRQTAFCLAIAPGADAVSALHAESHGGIPTQVIEVDRRVVERFMGGISQHEPGEPYVETAFRTILFTDLEGSTTLTQQLGDARATTSFAKPSAATAAPRSSTPATG